MISWWILCLITLSSQKIVSDAVVTVATIVKQPPGHAIEGEIITLNCTATCDNSTCEYIWSGNPITNSRIPVVQITVIRTFANRIFTCSVTDTGDGFSKNTTTTFDVYYGPDSVKLTVNSLTVDEGNMSDNHPVLCEVNHCYPQCNITWSRNAVALQTAIASQLSLFLTNTRYLRDTAGIYICQAKNTHFSKTQNSTIAITIRYPPVVTLRVTDTNTLECEAIGVPSIYTFQNIKHFVGSTLVRQLPIQTTANKATVTLTGSYEDTGLYECSVNNGITNYETKMLQQKDDYYARFNDVPVLVTAKENYNVSKGDKLTIEITVYSLLDVEDVSMTAGLYSILPDVNVSQHNVQIQFYGTNVDTTGQKVLLEFSDVLEDYFRTFTISVSNSLGTLPTNVTIFPKGPPDVPVNFTKADISHESVVFTIVTGFFNGDAQTLVLEYKPAGKQSDWVNGTVKYAGVQKNEQMRLEVRELTPETMYTFRVYSYNGFARSDYSVEISAKTMEASSAVGLVLGVVLGGVAVLVIIVILILVLRRRMQQNKGHHRGTHTEQNEDIATDIPTSYVNQSTVIHTKQPIPPPTIYENKKLEAGHTEQNEDIATDIPTSYVNQSTVIHTKQPIPPPTIYENTKLEAGTNATPERHVDQPDHAVYYNTNIPVPEALNTNSKLNNANYDSPRAPYFVLNNAAAVVEEAYLDTNEAKQLFEQNNKPSPVKKQETVEGDYLSMNDINAKRLVEPSSGNSNIIESAYIDNQSFDKPYENTEINQSNKNYQNVIHLTKNDVQTATPGDNELDKEPKDYRHVKHFKKLPHQQARVDSQSDTYVAMSPGRLRKRVVSVPDYDAPPPPILVEEEQYMNVRLGHLNETS